MLRLILAGLAAAMAFTALAAPTPASTVDHFHAVLLSNMEHGQTLGCSGRTQKMAAVVPATFDLPFISRQVLRHHWSELTPAQQATLVQAMQALAIATYAGQFARFSGEKFTTEETQSLPNGAQLVRAKLSLPNRDPVNFDYVLRLDDGHWKVINVVADGVSDLAIRSAQYERLFKEQGYDGLIGFLHKQIEQLQKTCP
ncbi:MAG TPA: ABC transporter substrate-binding protein [Stenotrophobium sp.]|nr:ABC transporter substrate-binding protein [Stenotrophobium sp.]